VKFTQEEWNVARELVQQNHEENAPALARFAHVVEKITQLAERGSLLTAWRTKNGGGFRDIPHEHWNTEKNVQRFHMCEMQPFRPFQLGSAGDNYCLIYVSRTTLSASIANLQSISNEKRQKRAPARAALRQKLLDGDSKNDSVTYHQLVALPGKKQQMVFNAIKETWKNGRVPKVLTIAQIQEKIHPVIKRMGDPAGASSDNIRRALGQKKK
jgi:hypothetical protein